MKAIGNTLLYGGLLIAGLMHLIDANVVLAVPKPTYIGMVLIMATIGAAIQYWAKKESD